MVCCTYKATRECINEKYGVDIASNIFWKQESSVWDTIKFLCAMMVYALYKNNHLFCSPTLRLCVTRSQHCTQKIITCILFSRLYLEFILEAVGATSPAVDVLSPAVDWYAGVFVLVERTLAHLVVERRVVVHGQTCNMNRGMN